MVITTSQGLKPGHLFNSQAIQTFVLIRFSTFMGSNLVAQGAQAINAIITAVVFAPLSVAMLGMLLTVHAAAATYWAP